MDNKPNIKLLVTQRIIELKDIIEKIPDDKAHREIRDFTEKNLTINQEILRRL